MMPVKTESCTARGLLIIRGLAEQIMNDSSKPEFNEARAKVILHTIEELEAQLKREKESQS
jgi:hypothetical protein